jgi:hypothetical protein
MRTMSGETTNVEQPVKSPFSQRLETALSVSFTVGYIGGMLWTILKQDGVHAKILWRLCITLYDMASWFGKMGVETEMAYYKVVRT